MEAKGPCFWFLPYSATQDELCSFIIIYYFITPLLLLVIYLLTFIALLPYLFPLLNSRL